MLPPAEPASLPEQESSLGRTTMEMQSRMSQQGSEDNFGELTAPSSTKGPEGAFFHHSGGLRWGVAELLLPSPEEQGCCRSSWTSGRGAWVDTMAPNSVRLDTRTLTSVKGTVRTCHHGTGDHRDHNYPCRQLRVMTFLFNLNLIKPLERTPSLQETHV